MTSSIRDAGEPQKFEYRPVTEVSGSRLVYRIQRRVIGSDIWTTMPVEFRRQSVRNNVLQDYWQEAGQP